ncbi:ABC transporter permease [Lysinibacillus fusiformis]|uniref:ABC transporter permease n=1 Tax=Lysinibacillus fusiformis TaxID=28031 RepID=UPI00050509CE|nr:FtsX-like permease family protein [Lysinibacillus fusiformis]KGA83015.1 ABC transporter permease [Lysinibacillus fusiformis]
MYAIVSLCSSYLRKRKLQNGLMVVLIFLSTLLLATSVTILTNTNNIFEKAHFDSNGAHQILTMGDDVHNPFAVNDWWQEQQGVTSSDLIPYKNLSGITFDGKEMPNLYLFMMDTPKMPSMIDQLLFSEGEKQTSPPKGTIWIPTSLASSAHISLGDAIEFNTGEITFSLMVSGVVVDMPYGGPFTTNARIWMNNTDYQLHLTSMSGTEQYMMALRFDNYEQSSSYWRDFENYLQGPYLESKMEYEEIASFYLIINKIIGFIMIAFGIAMLLVSLFIIGFSISDAILANYRTIGVMKSLGLSSLQISATYVLQFGLLSAFSIIPGLIVSKFLSRIILESSLSYLKAGNHLAIHQETRLTVLIALILFGIVVLTAFFYSNKARKVEPVQAIKYGMSESANSKINRRRSSSSRLFRLSNLPIQLQIGLKSITKNLKSSILIIALTSITSSILVFSVVILNSFISIKETSPSWGYDASHVVVTVFNKETFSKKRFEDFLLEDERIKDYAWLDQFTGVLPNGNNSPLNISVNVIEGSFDAVGYETMFGRNPVSKNEIAIGINVARSLNKNIGDIVEVYIEGKQHFLIITGIYQSIANMSNSTRISSDVIKVYNTTYSASEISMMNLLDETSAPQIVEDLNAHFNSSISAVTQQVLLDAVFKEVVAVLVIPLSIVGFLFIIVTCIIIFSVSRINVRKESSTYGIYKSIGMTSPNIRWSITSGILILSIFGAIGGFITGIKLIPLALHSIILEYGLLELPLVINWPMSIGISLVSVMAACFGGWVSTKVIAKTSPRILIVE